MNCILFTFIVFYLFIIFHDFALEDESDCLSLTHLNWICLSSKILFITFVFMVLMLSSGIPLTSLTVASGVFIRSKREPKINEEKVGM
jgi:hypothetical protein